MHGQQNVKIYKVYCKKFVLWLVSCISVVTTGSVVCLVDKFYLLSVLYIYIYIYRPALGHQLQHSNNRYVRDGYHKGTDENSSIHKHVSLITQCSKRQSYSCSRFEDTAERGV